ARSEGGIFVAAGATPGKIAILFPGQGSQKPGMLDELFVAFPWLLATDTARRHLRAVYPGAAFSPEARAAHKAAVTDTRVAQPALGVVDSAAARLLAACGVRGDLLAGHSYGELVALSVAGAFDGDTLCALSEARAAAILDAAAGAPGTMAAVRGPAADVARAI